VTVTGTASKFISVANGRDDGRGVGEGEVIPRVWREARVEALP
jgi:hypothetical protein